MAMFHKADINEMTVEEVTMQRELAIPAEVERLLRELLRHLDDKDLMRTEAEARAEEFLRRAEAAEDAAYSVRQALAKLLNPEGASDVF